MFLSYELLRTLLNGHGVARPGKLPIDLLVVKVPKKYSPVYVTNRMLCMLLTRNFLRSIEVTEFGH